MAEAEKLSLWDRFFNRYKRTIHARGSEQWFQKKHGVRISSSEYTRDWVEYLVVDRLTGSETIEKKYLN